MWPLIAFSEIAKLKTEVDIDGRAVIYHMKLKKGRHIRNPSYFRIIEESVWAMFGDNWKVLFKVVGRPGVLYGGTTRAPSLEKPDVRETGTSDRGPDSA